MKKIAPFGSWQSPITSDLIVSATIGLGAVAGDGNDIYWLEARPTEGGRNVLVRYTLEGKIEDVTPRGFNVRTRVHEYGGGAFLVADGVIYFVNFSDQRLYRQTPYQPPIPITEADNHKRYADFILDHHRNRLIAVCEDHSHGNHEPDNYLVSVDLESGNLTILVSGDDFYTCPCLSFDGSKLAFLSWNHPYMPWDTTTLSVAEITNDGSLKNIQVIASHPAESICQPQWSIDGKLYFSSDRSSWWNLYSYDINGMIEPLYPLDAEFGYPHWVFGESVYGLVSASELVCSYNQNGRWYLACLDIETQQLANLDIPYTSISHLQVQGNQVLFIGGAPTESTSVVKLDLATKQMDVLRCSSELTLDSEYISIPQEIEFPTENGLTAYGWYYAPKNADYEAPKNELPPLLVRSHGGPTSATSSNLNLRMQYWTSRGFAVIDVNYGGSTGYGREYRERLTSQWGIVDVDDCVNAAKYLVEQGTVDGNRLTIAGGSAGGFTTLAALTFRDTFKAGASYYGVSDLEALAKDTHKFEARYLDGLIGKYPEDKAIYLERSPIHHVEKLNCPIIFFQGLEDKIVPPNQAEIMVEALKNKGLPVAYVTFDGEQHGFRKAENIKRAIDAEFYFYSRIFSFIPADAIAFLDIMNL